VKKTYHIVSREEKTAAASIEQFAKSNGQFLLPLVELVTQARIAVDEGITSIDLTNNGTCRSSKPVRLQNQQLAASPGIFISGYDVR
jgi:hypothetical protein